MQTLKKNSILLFLQLYDCDSMSHEMLAKVTAGYMVALMYRLGDGNHMWIPDDGMALQWLMDENALAKTLHIFAAVRKIEETAPLGVELVMPMHPDLPVTTVTNKVLVEDKHILEPLIHHHPKCSVCFVSPIVGIHYCSPHYNLCEQCYGNYKRGRVKFVHLNESG